MIKGKHKTKHKTKSKYKINSNIKISSISKERTREITSIKS